MPAWAGTPGRLEVMRSRMNLSICRIVVTGRAGFLGSQVVEELGLCCSGQPDVIIHLAARTEGIGASRAHPVDSFCDDL